MQTRRGRGAYTARSGAWRSLVARGLWVAEVPGSNPGAPTFSSTIRATPFPHESAARRRARPAIASEGQLFAPDEADRAEVRVIRDRMAEPRPDSGDS